MKTKRMDPAAQVKKHIISYNEETKFKMQEWDTFVDRCEILVPLLEPQCRTNGGLIRELMKKAYPYGMGGFEATRAIKKVCKDYGLEMHWGHVREVVTKFVREQLDATGVDGTSDYERKSVVNGTSKQ